MRHPPSFHHSDDLVHVRRRWAAACLLPGRRGGGAGDEGFRHLNVIAAEEVGERDAEALILYCQGVSIMNDQLFLAVRKNLDRRKRRQRAWPEGRREFE